MNLSYSNVINTRYYCKCVCTKISSFWLFSFSLVTVPYRGGLAIFFGPAQFDQIGPQIVENVNQWAEILRNANVSMLS